MDNNLTYPLKGRRILIAVSGSIAAVKTPLLVSQLVKGGAEVRCVITPSAAHLVSPLALSTLSRNSCYQDKDQWIDQQSKPLHIELAEWAELIVIAPLSASTLGRWAHGLGEGLLASILLAFEKTIIAAPSMNTGMWSNEAVIRNWKEIKNNEKVISLEPTSGLLACDRIGEGKMVEPDLIELAIKNVIFMSKDNGIIKRDWKNKRIIVTAGPTYEFFDKARILTNRSSGKMGVLLAQAARFRGAKVDLVHGPIRVSKAWLDGLKTHKIYTSNEMSDILNKLQPLTNAIAMTSAIADIKKKHGSASSKLSKKDFLESFGENIETVPDLLAELCKNRPKGQVLLGFAALTGKDSEIQEKGISKMISKGCDLLMANPIDRPGQGFDENFNGGYLLGANKFNRFIPVTSKIDLAHQLLDSLLKISV